MAAVFGQQMISIANSTLKMASTVLSIHEQRPWWTNSILSNLRNRQFKEYTLEEISLHDSPSDCWIVLYDKVYDVTNFMDEHVGGKDVILDNAGRDATVAFCGIHGKALLQELSENLVGVLVSSERMYSEDLESSL